MPVRLVAAVVTVMAGVPALVGLGATKAAAQSFQPVTTGDLIVSLANGQVNEYTPTGTLVQTLISNASLPTGSSFDSAGNLYVTEFHGNDIVKVNAQTGAESVFSNNTILADGTSYNSPESIVFSPDYTKMYVSDANRYGTGGGIHVVSATTGKGLGFYSLPTSSGFDGTGQSDWLALNSSSNLYMTNENKTQGVMQVNQSSGDVVQPSFVPNLPNIGYGISFDPSGNLWVSDTDRVVEYSPTGTLLQTITNSSFSVIFAAALDPSASSFYAGDESTGNVFAYGLNGTLKNSFSLGSGINGLTVASVKGIVPEGSVPGGDYQGGGSPSEPLCACVAGDPIQVATGDYFESSTDLKVPGAGIPLTFSRTYDSFAAQAGRGSTAAGSTAPEFGPGWFDNLDMTVSYNSSTQIATVTEENGAQLTFQYYLTGSTEPAWCPSDASSAVFCSTAPRMLGQLQNSNGTSGTWTFTRKLSSPLTFTFSSTGVLTGMSDLQGDTVTASSYTGTACPSGDTCTQWSEPSASDSLIVAKAPVSGSLQIAKVFELTSGITATYTMSTSSCASPASSLPELCSATEPGTLTTSYTYSGSTDQLLTMTSPTGQVVTNTFSGNHVATQCITPGSGIAELMTFSYSTDSALVNGSDTTVTTYPNGAGNGCSVSGSPATDVKKYRFSNDVLVEEDDAPGTSSASTIDYTIDATTLLPTGRLDSDDHLTKVTLNNYRQSGSQFSSADPTLQTDGVGNQSQNVFTADNLKWCSVDAADYLNGTRCPSTQPSGPPAPGASDPNLGVTLSWYDSSDHLTATTDPLGNTTTYSYTNGVSGVPNGLRYCSVDPVDYQKSVTCPAYGVTHVTGTVTETLDGTGNVLSSTDAVGNTSSFCYYYQTTGCAASAPSGGSGGNPQLLYSTTDPDGNKTANTYDAAGHLLTQVKTFGSYSATTINAYTPGGLLYCTIAPLAYSQGHTACPSSPPSSPPAAGADPWPGATITIYDNQARPLDQVNPLGGVTQNAYDEAGEKYCTVSPTAYAQNVTCPSIPPASPPTIGNDPYVGATITTFDPDGRVIQVTNPLGGIKLSSYDPAGNLSQTTAESNNSTSNPNVVTSYSYDADNRVIATTVDPSSSLAATTANSYDPNGNVYCSVSANAETQGGSAFHCPTWQTTWITTPPNPSSLYSTSPSASQANNVTTAFFNAVGEQIQSTNPDIQTTVGAFDGDGRTYCSADPTNVASWLSAHSGATYPYLCPASAPTSPPGQGSNPGYVTSIFNAAGQLLSKTDQVGDTTSYTYDPAGGVATTTDPRGKITTNCYYHQNGTGQCAASAPAGGGSATDVYSTTTPSTSADPSGETTTTTYFPGGLTDITTTPAGVTTNAYDTSRDLTAVTYSNTAAGYATPANLTYSYNQDATRHTIGDATGTTTYSYDKAGDLTSQALSARSGSGLSNTTVSYSFYTTGTVASLIYPSYGSYTNPTVNYAYDGTGTMTSETDWLANKVTFNHDSDGNQTNQANNVTTSNPNGTSSTAFAYDNADYNTTATSTLAQTCGGNETLTQSFSGTGGSRNPDGQVTQDQESYAGSCSGQGSYQRNYSYDIAGRVVYQGSTTQGTNPNNFAYDPSGDPTTISSHDSAGNFNTYTQSFDNAGETLSQAPMSGSHGSTTNYKYDTLGDQTGAAGTSYGYDQISRLTTVLSQAQTIATKKEHTVAVKSDGTVWDWGLNTYGELGNNTTTNSSTPVQVSGLTGAVSVGAGDWQTVALKSDGTVWDWGRNATDGQLGNGNNTTNSSVPVQVSNMSGAVAVSAGGDSTFAVKSDGTLWGWGSDAYGQLGNNSTTNVDVPVQASGLTGVIGVAAGYHFTVALKSDGTVWTMGQNDGGQLGNGTTTNSSVPVQVSNLTGAIAVSAGDDYGMALKSDGTIWSWGHNEHGQLGNNSTSNSSTPVQASGISNAIAISGEEDAGLAVKSDGSAWAWGLNNNGQLGIGNTTDSHVPVQVHNLTNVVQVAGGLDDSIALKNDGTLWGWGLNNNGELGNGTTNSSNVPTQTNMTSVATSTSGTSATYIYNGDKLTAGKTAGGTTSQYTWALLGTSSLPLIVSDSTNDYIYGPAGTPIEQIALSNSTPTYMTYTPSDSSWLTTNSAGDQTGFWRYDAYGTLALGTPASPFGYSGQYIDGTTSLVNDRARWFQPQTGGFTSRDAAFATTDSAYTYATDDPINLADASGMATFSCQSGTCGTYDWALAGAPTQKQLAIWTYAVGVGAPPWIQLEPEIDYWAHTFGINPYLVASVIAHEGGCFNTWRGELCYALDQYLGADLGIAKHSLGIAKVREPTAEAALAACFPEELNSRFSGNDRSGKIRQALVNDPGFSVQIATAVLANLQYGGGRNLSDEQTFLAYAVSPETLTALVNAEWDLDRAFNSGTIDGTTYDNLTRREDYFAAAEVAVGNSGFDPNWPT